MAITAGIDAGAKNTKVVIYDGEQVLGRGMASTGFDQAEAVEKALDLALEAGGLERDALARTVSTGAGRKNVPPAQADVTEVTADARAAIRLMPQTRTVIDVGAEEGRGISVDEKGSVVDFAVNEKCAAGAGAFTEAMSRALEMKIEDIARSVHDAISSRITSMVRRVGLKPDVILVGGVGNNVGFKKSLETDLGMAVTVPELPEYVTALGAALIAQEQVGR